MSLLTVSPVKASERLKNLSETPLYVKALIYGDSGAGKTWLACTAPNPLLILSEWAISRTTLERLRRDRGIDPATIIVNSWQDFMEAYAYARANVEKYGTVVVDSLTDLNDRAIEEVLREQTGALKSGERMKAHDPDMLEIGDWGRVLNRTLRAVKLFRDLPCHVVMTALAEDVKGEMFTAPMAAPRKLQKRLPSQFNLVGYLVAEQRPGKPSVRKLYLDLTNTFQAKNPGGLLSAVVENPDLGELFQQITSMEREAEQSTKQIS